MLGQDQAYSIKFSMNIHEYNFLLNASKDCSEIQRFM